MPGIGSGTYGHAHLLKIKDTTIGRTAATMQAVTIFPVVMSSQLKENISSKKREPPTTAGSSLHDTHIHLAAELLGPKTLLQPP